VDDPFKKRDDKEKNKEKIANEINELEDMVKDEPRYHQILRKYNFLESNIPTGKDHPDSIYWQIRP
jgi:hypothetical protein